MKQISHFSIIVPVYNGANTLDDCLTALVDQDYPPDQYEIIVVNDGSTDNTAEIASRYPVRLINLETNQGRITARNTGAEAAKYTTLVFNDARLAGGALHCRRYRADGGVGPRAAGSVRVGSARHRSRVGGIPDVLEEGVNGFLAQPGDAADLARQIVRALREADWQQFSAAASRTAERYDWAYVAGQYAETFHALAQHASSGE